MSGPVEDAPLRLARYLMIESKVHRGIPLTDQEARLLIAHIRWLETQDAEEEER